VPLVIFVAPWFSGFALRAVEALVGLPDVSLAIINQDSQEKLAPHLRDAVAGHRRVENVFDGDRIAHAAGSLSNQMGRPIDRLFGALEQLQVPLAEAREKLGVEGMGVEAARNFRDKARMKTVLREAGVPCARHGLATSEAEAWAFAEEVGYPLVVKPPAGAGSLSTFRVNDDAALGEALCMTAPDAREPVLLEEFITGDEHSFETISVGGRAVRHSLTHYYPAPLEVLRNP
jgi:biotin carboxylase